MKIKKAVMVLMAAGAVMAFLTVGAAYVFNSLNFEKLKKTSQCPNCDLSGAQVFWKDLNGAVLSGANLSNAKLVGKNLSGAVLSGAVLTGAGLIEANLTGATRTDGSKCKIPSPGAYNK